MTNHKTRLQQVREKVIGVVPEIMDLKFGCRVKVGWNHNFKIRTIVEVDKGVLRLDFSRQLHTPEQLSYDKTVEILGRPIRLADVLLAMDKAYEELDAGLTLEADFGSFCLRKTDGCGCHPDETVWTKHAEWNLKKNSLDEQSEDTIQFLHEILCQN